MFDLGEETALAEREDLDPDKSRDAKAAVSETPGREGSACREGHDDAVEEG